MIKKSYNLEKVSRKFTNKSAVIKKPACTLILPGSSNALGMYIRLILNIKYAGAIIKTKTSRIIFNLQVLILKLSINAIYLLIIK